LVLNSFQTSGNSPGTPRCLVDILGFGSVGSAIARRLTGPDSIPSLELTHICDRRARDKRARQPESSLNRIVWTDTFDDLLAGGEATAVAAFGDLVPIARDHAAIVPAPPVTEPTRIRGLVDHKLAEAV
jgi:homoserine dehydrogenase